MTSDDMELIASQIRARIAAKPDLQKWVNERLGGVTAVPADSSHSASTVLTPTNDGAPSVARTTPQTQALAVMRVLVAVVRADRVVDQREKRMLSEFASALGVTREEFQSIAAEKPAVNIAHLPASGAERCALLTDAFSLALADGTIAPQEQSVVERLAKALNVGPQQLESCLRAARKRTGNVAKEDDNISISTAEGEQIAHAIKILSTANQYVVADHGINRVVACLSAEAKRRFAESTMMNMRSEPFLASGRWDFELMTKAKYYGMGLAFSGFGSIPLLIAFGRENKGHVSLCEWTVWTLGDLCRRNDIAELDRRLAESAVGFLVEVLDSLDPAAELAWKTAESIGEFRGKAETAMPALKAALGKLNRMQHDARVIELYQTAIEKIRSGPHK